MFNHRRAVFVVALLCVALIVVLVRDTASAPFWSQKSAPTNHKPAVFDKHAHSLTDPASIWVIVNKQHPLSPLNYVPTELVVPHMTLRSSISTDERHVSTVMAPALEALVAGAHNVGLTLTLQSGYRSYNFQVSLYNSYVRSDGQANADRYSARPGYSEHQTGLAADIGGTSQPNCNVAQCFATTSEGKWLAEHAYLYGFIVRYTAAKESITGYEDEPWHIRYVGTELANEMHTQGVLTLEDFFNVSGGTTYK